MKKPLNLNNQPAAIVVPWYTRDYILPEEEISIDHLRHFLGDYDKFLVIPEGLDFTLKDLTNIEFEKKYFGSAKAFDQLLFSPYLYKLFDNYKYILIYHPDALVFSDQLDYWCQQGYDYIAPPWIPHPNAPYHKDKFLEGQIGNGGFSLRKVKSFYKITKSKSISIKSRDEVYYDFGELDKINPIIRPLKKLLISLRFFPLEKRYTIDDFFWGVKAQKYNKSFRIPTMDVALKFGFECEPTYAYEKNHRELPFGCHAWTNYDRNFWNQFLLSNERIR